jgi:hypothetical protein
MFMEARNRFRGTDPPACVAWLAGTTNRVVTSCPPSLESIPGLLNPNPHTVPFIPNQYGNEGRARDSRPPPPQPPGNLSLTGKPDESR